MPTRLLHFLEAKSFGFHLSLALALGLALRVATACFSYGPMAIDDYLHALLPALSLSKTGSTELIEYRSYLLVWLLAGFHRTATVLGVPTSDLAAEIRWMCACLGVLSLLGIYGAYLYARAALNHIAGPLLLYLVSFHFIMPFCSTRAFGETVSVAFVFLGLGLGERGAREQSPKWAFWGLLLLGVSTLFRFHNGLLFLTFWVVLALRDKRFLGVGLMAGILTLALEIGIDLVSGRAPLSTLLAYVRSGRSVYGIQVTATFFFLGLAVVFFPLSLTLVRAVPRVVKEHGRAALCLLVFLLAHSVLDQKEERYFFPALPFLLVILAACWAEACHRPLTRKLFAPAALLLNGVLLALVTFNNSQSASFGPLVQVQQRHSGGIFLERNTQIGGNALASVFLRPGFRFERADALVDPATIGNHLSHQAKGEVLAILEAADPTHPLEIERLTGQLENGIHCSRLQSAGALIDNVIYRANPKKNWRRRPTYFIECTL